MESLLLKALKRTNTSRPPVWFMRQAGRYHSHYQSIREKQSFVDLCKIPSLSAEVALGPVMEFGFDAAILFSDILFTLEAMGFGLDYENTGPKLSWQLRQKADLKHIEASTSASAKLDFQGEAIKALRKSLPDDKAVIGFSGAPLTLFVYAVQGRHVPPLSEVEEGLRDGRFEGFCEPLIGILAESLAMQARSGADVITLFDTSAGDITFESYKQKVIPTLTGVVERFRAQHDTPIIYYSKGTDHRHFDLLSDINIDCIGVDHRQNVKVLLEKYRNRFSVQGNFDQNLLLLPENEFDEKLTQYLSFIGTIPTELRRGYICGLGHGVLPKTPQRNVKKFIESVHNFFEKQ